MDEAHKSNFVVPEEKMSVSPGALCFWNIPHYISCGHKSSRQDLRSHQGTKGEAERRKQMGALLNFVKRYKDIIINCTWSLKKLIIKIFKNLRS